MIYLLKWAYDDYSLTIFKVKFKSLQNGINVSIDLGSNNVKVIDQYNDVRLFGASISSLLQHVMDTFSRIVSRGVYHDLNDIDRAEPI